MTHRPVLRYLSHPQVMIDANVPVTDWGLNDVGAARVASLCAGAATGTLRRTTSVFTSPERKARDTAHPLARALCCSVHVMADSHENDRSATGYLPGPAFEDMADAFFAHPEHSASGWERAIDAQARICASVTAMRDMAPPGDILVVGHGAVGTLLYCAWAAQPITRAHDQGPGGGGNIITFDRVTLVPAGPWQLMEHALQA